ncbi:MAG TPA: hypothetical protein VN032_10275, partial [Thermoanaerobaculia bacterium]|nr:hypothetical protein [Thermoanaerobaculia bacterium]
MGSGQAAPRLRPRRRHRGARIASGVPDLTAAIRTIAVALPLPLRRNFTYGLAPAMPAPLPGTRVRVPFGERVLTGVVV